MDLNDYPITSNWLEVDNIHSTPHTGIDLATPTGIKIYAKDSGIVSLTIDDLLGNTVRLKLNNGDIIVYGHLSKFEVQNGQFVKAGDLLGLTGGAVGSINSGRTTGSHVHISHYHEGTLIDPTNYLFHHEQQGISSPLIFPVMIILLLIIIFKARKWLFYGLGLFLLIGAVFLAY